MPRAQYIGHRLLLNKIEGVEIEEPNDSQRYMQEQFLTGIARLTLLGVDRGAIEAAASRNSRLEAFTSKAHGILRGTIMRNHTALGSSNSLT